MSRAHVRHRTGTEFFPTIIVYASLLIRLKPGWGKAERQGRPANFISINGGTPEKFHDGQRRSQRRIALLRIALIGATPGERAQAPAHLGLLFSGCRCSVGRCAGSLGTSFDAFTAKSRVLERADHQHHKGTDPYSGRSVDLVRPAEAAGDRFRTHRGRLAFALQRVVTAAVYLIILRGMTFNVGDRIVRGGVLGDVVALSFMQTDSRPWLPAFRLIARPTVSRRVRAKPRRAALVRVEGIEPPWPFGQRILSPSRLPVPPHPPRGSTPGGPAHHRGGGRAVNSVPCRLRQFTRKRAGCPPPSGCASLRAVYRRPKDKDRHAAAFAPRPSQSQHLSQQSARPGEPLADRWRLG